MLPINGMTLTELRKEFNELSDKILKQKDSITCREINRFTSVRNAIKQIEETIAHLKKPLRPSIRDWDKVGFMESEIQSRADAP